MAAAGGQQALAICLGNLKHHLRAPFAAGYGLPDDAELRRMIEAGLIYIILISATRHLEDSFWLDWSRRRFSVIAREYCPRRLRGEPFIDEI